MIISWVWIVTGLRASSVRGLESRQAGLHLCNMNYLAKTSQGAWTYQRNFSFSPLKFTLFLLTVSPFCLDKIEAGIVQKAL